MAMRPEPAAVDGNPRLAMAALALLIAVLGYGTYLSLDRAEPRPNLPDAFATTTD